MNQPDNDNPTARHGLRPRIRAIADDADQPLSAPDTMTAHAAAFEPYRSVPQDAAAAPIRPSTGSSSAPGYVVPMPVAGQSWEELLGAARPPVPAERSAWDEPPVTGSSPIPAPSTWDTAAAGDGVPVPATVPGWQVSPPLPQTRVYDVSPTALASAPPPTAEPDLEWLHEPVPTETGSWSLDIDDEASGESEQADLRGADHDLVAALQEVLFAKASDLHVTVNAAPTIRVDGGLRPIEGTHVWGRTKVTAALESILTDTQKETFARELELDFAYTISSNARFRVNMYQQRGSIGAAFRLIPTEIKTLKELGIPETVSRFATLARGLVLVTGPTGSGKSTTLAALVDLVNRTRADHIVTVEDPIEFLHGNHKSLVNQREVGPDTHSFAAALKHVLRQDPDVILIGELRDLETISVALTAAETGHLVFATLHTQDAAQTIDRVIDVFPPHQQGQVRTQLAATLQGVVCQTLVKMASGKGRVVATEVLVTTPAIGNLIREGKTYQITSALQAGRELGMYTMDQHLAELVDAGKITHAAAMSKAHDLDSLKRLIHRADPGLTDAARQMSVGSIDFDDDAQDLGTY